MCEIGTRKRRTQPIRVPADDRPVLGLDLSLTATGIALLRGGTLDAGVASPPKGEDRGMARIDWFRRHVEAVLDAARPVLVTVEGYSFGSRNSQSHAAGELGGMVRWALWRRGIDCVDVPPTSLKKFATGRGTGDKGVVMVEAYKRWGIDLDDNNACDAAALAVLGLALLRGCDGMDLAKPQREALKGLEVATGFKTGAAA